VARGTRPLTDPEALALPCSVAALPPYRFERLPRACSPPLGQSALSDALVYSSLKASIFSHLKLSGGLERRMKRSGI
jgi:hypothetical protein